MTMFSRQRGVVIVVALFIVALVATMSYVMIARLERDIHRTSLILHNVQAQAYAEGSLAWAMGELQHNWEAQKPNKVIDPIPINSPDQTENGYQIKSTIYDMQARFNLNNLSSKAEQEIFKRLIQNLAPKMSAESIQQIVLATSQWIAPGANQNETAAKYYFQLKYPYRPAQRPMVSISEFRMVKGVTPALYAAVSPFVTALPESTKVNVQTASPLVLMALSKTLPMASAKYIEGFRRQTPFTKPDVFLKLAVVNNHGIKADQITVVSSYFLVETQVTMENQHLVLYTLLMRKASERKAEVSILWQSKGVW